MGKRVLITGGAGFIGSNFVRHVFNKHPDYDITVLDALTYCGNIENIPAEIREATRFSFRHGSITDEVLVCELVADADVVVHFAAESHVTRSLAADAVFFETNVIGTMVLADGVKNAGTVERFIHISSSEVYGTACRVPMDEDHPLNPTTPYAASKSGADRLVYSFFTAFGLPAVIIRPFNCYGPNQHPEKAIPRFITSALRGEPLIVHGSGQNTRDWLHVDDLCRGIDMTMHASLDKVKGEVINLGTGREINIGDIAAMVLEQAGTRGSRIISIPDRRGQVLRNVSSSEKAASLLNWQPETRFEDGLVPTVAWYRRHPEWWTRLIAMSSLPLKSDNGEVACY